MPTANWTERNADGVLLRGQTGNESVVGFDAIIAGLSPELRAAFEAEREAQAIEFSQIVTEHGYHT